MNPLRNFYNNTTERSTVKTFFREVMEQMAIDRAFRGESVTGIKEGWDCVEKSFDKLEELYGKIDAAPISNSR